jgi:chaperone required for assembly of F1-ATPase
MRWQADQGRQVRTPLKKCLPLGMQRILCALILKSGFDAAQKIIASEG